LGNISHFILAIFFTRITIKFPLQKSANTFFFYLSFFTSSLPFEVNIFMQIRVRQPKYYKNHFSISQTFLQSLCHKGKLYYAYYRRITRMNITLFRRQLRNLGPWVENRVVGSIGFPEFPILYRSVNRDGANSATRFRSRGGSFSL
jgi:hypothetical protein